MANALDALIDRIPDETLQGQIREALKKQNQQKKFGLVFEDHIPESTVLYDVPVKAGSTVALRGGDRSFLLTQSIAIIPTENRDYPFLNPEDIEVMDAIIQRFGNLPKAEIVEIMHQEDAYTETAPGDIIQFKYAKTLSLS